MWFKWFIFLCDCLIPVLMIVVGRMMWKHCPKQINGVVGYRTKRSMKNMDTWKFAHLFAGKLWWRAGWGLLAAAVLVHIIFYGADENMLGVLCTVVITVELIFLIGSIIPTEIALKNHFHKDGTRRQVPVH
ncbi:MAG: SdpI family protein [Lachnospiraceae bacterium]|nr:SdpI family protein [Lachnospiraceae bacterium]